MQRLRVDSTESRCRQTFRSSHRSLRLILRQLGEKARGIRSQEQPETTLGPEEVTVLLLDRLNVAISSDMGQDFELGHSFFWPVVTAVPARRWNALFQCWDTSVFPQ